VINLFVIFYIFYFNFMIYENSGSLINIDIHLYTIRIQGDSEISLEKKTIISKDEKKL
jgi:hypothetical protein